MVGISAYGRGSLALFLGQNQESPLMAARASYVPRMETLNKATAPAAKLALARPLAENLATQAAACARAGNPARCTDLMSQCTQVMTSTTEAVRQLANASTNAKNYLKTQQPVISQTLQSLHDALSSLSRLTSKASGETKTSLLASLKTADAAGAAIAKKCGLSWAPLTASSTKSTSSNLVDLTA